jgi:hypothetical protein
MTYELRNAGLAGIPLIKSTGQGTQRLLAL